MDDRFGCELRLSKYMTLLKEVAFYKYTSVNVHRYSSSNRVFEDLMTNNQTCRGVNMFMVSLATK